MPRRNTAIDELKDEIGRRVLEEHDTHDQLLSWLEGQGVSIKKSTLIRRCKEWGFTRRAQQPVTPQLVERIEELFRTTFLTDLEIATHLLKEDSLFTSPNQVKEIRIANNW